MKNREDMKPEELLKSALIKKSLPKIEHKEVELIGEGIDFKEIKIHRKKRGIQDKVADWNSLDFGLYLSKVYYKKFTTRIGLYTRACESEMLILKDCLLEQLGEVDNFILKSYIDFYFESGYPEDSIRKYGSFYINNMRNPSIILKFKKNYVKPDNKVISNLKKEDSLSVKESDLETSYYLGNENLVLQYGIIIPINWLVMKKNYNIKEAIELISKAYISLIKKNLKDKVIEMTEKYSPYPSWLFYNDCENLLKHIENVTNDKLKIQIIFQDDIKGFDFLGEKNK